MSEVVLNFLMSVLKNAIKLQDGMIYDYLKLSGGDGVSSDVLLDIIKTIGNYFQVAGMGLAIIYFLIEMNNTMGFSGGNITLKSFAMPFAKLCLAIFLLSYSSTAVSSLLGLNDVLVDKWNSWSPVSSSTPTPSGKAELTDDAVDDPDNDTFKIKERLKKMNMFQALALIIPVLLCWLVSMILNLIWIYKAIAYKLELAFRVSLTPLAIVDCYATNTSAVIKWLKSILALVIYGSALMILAKLGTASLMVSVLTEDLTIMDWLLSLVEAFVLPFAVLGVSGAVKQVCKEALS